MLTSSLQLTSDTNGDGDRTILTGTSEDEGTTGSDDGAVSTGPGEAKKVSIIAKGSRAKASVFSGKKQKTMSEEGLRPHREGLG